MRWMLLGVPLGMVNGGGAAFLIGHQWALLVLAVVVGALLAGYGTEAANRRREEGMPTQGA